MKPQTKAVYYLLAAHPEGITGLDAWRAIGCYRLASRVNELRKAGYPVTMTLETDPDSGVRFGRYRLPAAE